MIFYILLGIAIFLLILLILGRPKEDGKEKKKANITIISTIASVIVGIILVIVGGMLAAIFGGK